NSRVRQPDTIITPRQRVTRRATSAPSIPAPPDSGALPSTRPPLHSLVVSSTSELDLRFVVLGAARPVAHVVEFEKGGRRAPAPLAVDEGALPSVARPDCALDRRRDVPRAPLGPLRRSRLLDDRRLLRQGLLVQAVDRQGDDVRRIAHAAVRQQILELTQLVVGLL